MAVGLQPLEDLLGVVQHGGSGIEGDGPVWLNSSSMPSTFLAPANVDHMVGEMVAESRIGQNGGVLLLRAWLLVLLHQKL